MLVVVQTVCDRNNEMGALTFDRLVRVFGTKELFVELVWACSHHIGIDNRSIILPQDILECVEKVWFFVYDWNQEEKV